MMKTKIFTSRKLEKIVSKHITKEKEKEEQISPLGKWNANVFYINRKKCWLIINKLTRYVLVLSDIKSTDLKNFEKIFTETLYSQLIYDGIIIEYNLIEKIIGKIELLKTDNDRSVNGSINNRIWDFEYWKYEFGTLENMPMRDLNGRLNNQPIEMFNWKNPKEMMDELIKASA